MRKDGTRALRLSTVWRSAAEEKTADGCRLFVSGLTRKGKRYEITLQLARGDILALHRAVVDAAVTVRDGLAHSHRLFSAIAPEPKP